ncbi:MAG: glycosyltransferase family 2 protein [Treponema sp.]|nr:glycosyltransferase family 2 protein [Treponema sp.]
MIGAKKKSERNPLISVCIPVFSTEPFLAQCLRSVITQDFPDFEVVVVSDASRGKDAQGRSAKKIVRFVQKECDRLRKEKHLPLVPLRFVEHKENRGLIEVRRTLCYEANGFYMTQCDSDDEMAENALSALYAVAAESGADIVHGTSTAGVFDAEGHFTPIKENRYGKIFYGRIDGHDVFRRWLLNGDFTANTWGKLIKRELWQRAYEHIPYTECNMADDVLLFFFLSHYARSYIGIEAKVYRYRVNTGMTSQRKIDTMHKWKMICSTASVFTVISTYIEESGMQEQVQPDEVQQIRNMTRRYLANNIMQMREVVVPELQEKARAMLCEYWGESFVQKMEAGVAGLKNGKIAPQRG